MFVLTSDARELHPVDNIGGLIVVPDDADPTKYVVASGMTILGKRIRVSEPYNTENEARLALMNFVLTKKPELFLREAASSWQQ